jgi:hypothetical protein
MVSGSGRYAEYGAVAGAHRPQTSDLTSKKMSPDGSLLSMTFRTGDTVSRRGDHSFKNLK